MANDLQALLTRINEEGLKKADAERQAILDQAQADARRIVEEARAQADKTVNDARREAALLLEKGRESLRQAARDVLLSLRQQLQERLVQVIRGGTGQALTPEVLGRMLTELVRAYAAQGGTVDRIDVLLGERDAQALGQSLLAGLGESLRQNCHLQPVPDIAAGFRVVFNGADIEYDFSDAALADALSTYLSPKLAELVRGK